MREKKAYTVITFHTTTEAMAFERACLAEGVPGRLIPVPREISSSCGLAFRIPVEDYPAHGDWISAGALDYDTIAQVMI